MASQSEKKENEEQRIIRLKKTADNRAKRRSIESLVISVKRKNADAAKKRKYISEENEEEKIIRLKKKADYKAKKLSTESKETTVKRRKSNALNKRKKFIWKLRWKRMFV